MPRQKKQHLKRRKDGRFACRYKDQWFYGFTEDEALQAREEYKKLEAIGEKPKALTTVYDYASRWLPIAKPNVTEKTYHENATLINKLLDVVGQVPINEVVPSQIKNVFSLKFKGLSASYIKTARQLYIALFDAAMADGYCKTNPVKDKSAQPHRGTSSGHRAITAQEREWINTLCTDHRAWPAVMVMLYAGLRPQEMKALNIDESVDFKAGVINLVSFAHLKDWNHYEITARGKTDRAVRTIPLTSTLRAALEGKHGPIIANEDGSPLTISGWHRLWQSYVNCMERELNGMQKRWYGKTRAHKALLAEKKPLPQWISFTVKPYDLRHSFCTMCRDRGVEINTCIRWMGHANASMVLKVYDEVSDQRSAEEARKLE